VAQQHGEMEVAEKRKGEEEVKAKKIKNHPA
jgi:hypothetical protein